MRTHTVTEDNIEQVRRDMAAPDQARELEIGCTTWGFLRADGQRGQLTRWPNGRGAVCWGGNSHWGIWRGRRLTLDDGPDPDGMVDEFGVYTGATV